MILREAVPSDINDMLLLRLAVTENRLSNPALVTVADYHDYLFNRGRGWVCETDNKMVGFGIVSVVDHNVWALFVHPQYSAQGIARSLQYKMLDWYFAQTTEDLWLSTEANTRAEKFYRRAGWKETGTYGKGEIKFVMTASQWMFITNK